MGECWGGGVLAGWMGLGERAGAALELGYQAGKELVGSKRTGVIGVGLGSGKGEARVGEIEGVRLGWWVFKGRLG